MPDRMLWGFLLAAYLWFGALAAFEQIRWTYYLHSLYPIALAALLAVLLKAARSLRPGVVVALAQVMMVVLFLMAPPLTFIVLGESTDARGQPVCGPANVAAALRAAPHHSHDIVLASVFQGSEILYRTDFDVVIGPYHRNAAGTHDSYAIMAATDFEEARRVAATRGIRFIAVCKNAAWYPLVRPDAEGTLYHALQTGHPPYWLEELPPSSSDHRVAIWEVVSG